MTVLERAIRAVAGLPRPRGADEIPLEERKPPSPPDRGGNAPRRWDGGPPTNGGSPTAARTPPPRRPEAHPIIRAAPEFRRVGIADFHLTLPDSLEPTTSTNRREAGLHDFSLREIADRKVMAALPDYDMLAQLVKTDQDNQRGSRILITAYDLSRRAGSERPNLDVLLSFIRGTRYEVVVRTNDAAIASPPCLHELESHRNRVTIGVMLPTLDEEVLSRLDPGGSPVPGRLRAYEDLRNAGFRTCAFLGPFLPDAVCQIEAMVRAVRPERTEAVWSAPLHGGHWRRLRAAFEPDSPEYAWFTAVFERGQEFRWSRFAADVYVRLALKARAGGWLSKLRFLLDEDRMLPMDAELLDLLEGVVLLGPTDAEGCSLNPSIRRQQKKAAFWTRDAQFPNGHPGNFVPRRPMKPVGWPEVEALGGSPKVGG